MSNNTASIPMAKILVYSRNPASYMALKTASDRAASVWRFAKSTLVDPDAVVYDIGTMQDRLYRSMARQRFASVMLTAFAAFALLLAAVGIYGVMSYTGSAKHPRYRRTRGAGREPQEILQDW